MFDWNKKYETLDEIDEDKRGAFEEKDGKFQVVKALDPSGLKATLEKKNAEIKALKPFKQKLEGMGLEDDALETLVDDLDELSDLRAQKEAGDLGGGDAEKKVEELVAKRVEAANKKHQRELNKALAERDEAKEELGQAKGALKTVSLETKARALATKHKIADHSIDDVLLKVSGAFDLDEEGNPSREDGMSLDDWFDETVPTKPGWTFNPQNSGSGADGGGNGAGGRTVKMEQYEKMSPADQAAIAEKASAGELSLVD